MKRSKTDFSLASRLLISSIALAPFATNAHAYGNEQYACQAGPDGGWVCGEHTPDAGPIKRPARPQKLTVIQKASGEAVIIPKHLVKDYAKAEQIQEQQAGAPRYDWVPVSRMSAEQRKKVPAHCVGAYIEPPGRDRSDDPAGAPLNASAANTIEAAGNEAVLDRDVLLRQGYRELRSDRATVRKDERSALLEGNISYREPGVLIVGERAAASMNSGAAIIENAELVIHEAHTRSSAQTLIRHEDGRVEIENGTFTTCPPGSESWKIDAKNIELNPNTGFGEAKGAALKLAGVPVLYMPYWFFPLDDRRQSGFLFPSISHSSENGTEISTPYYLNLAPNYDATITPRYLSKRGAALETELRHMSRYDEAEIGFGYLASDNEYNNDARWLYGAKERGYWSNNWRTRIDYTRVSDDDYFEDLGSELNVSSSTNLLQLGEVSKYSKFWDFTTRVQAYQTIGDSVAEIDKPYYRLPQLEFRAAVPSQFAGHEYLFQAEYAHFDHDRDSRLLTAAEIADGAEVTGQRLYLEPGIRYLFSRPGGYFGPTLKVKHNQFFLSNTPVGSDSSASTTVPMLALDGGLFFERDFNFGKGSFVHTLEPRARYLLAPYEQQDGLPNFDSKEQTFSLAQLFREDRFSGHDRIGDTNQLAIALTTRILEDTTGRERMRFDLGKAFYYADRKVSLETDRDDFIDDTASSSPWAAEGQLRAGDAWRILGELQFDDHEDRFLMGGVGVRMQPDVDHVLNISYRHRNALLGEKQSDISFIWPVWRDWSALGRWNRDLKRHRNLETLAGLEYEGCCWKMRLVHRRWINDGDNTDPNEDNTNSGVFMQFVLKGLGGAGSKVDSILDDGIPGYRKREDESNQFGGALLY